MIAPCADDMGYPFILSCSTGTLGSSMCSTSFSKKTNSYLTFYNIVVCELFVPICVCTVTV